ncbi:putative methyltransferase DDB_G0268948 [Pseudophryne corroboree]|uniref:putative methyltransferase DDB_G0268948 n=1 Tax=Pseudophryne corroboree TaxID=495146 RepID=UPI003082094D
MDTEIFKSEEYSKVYQDNMVPVSEKVLNLILSYLEEKKGRPFELAVDAGCGTGRSTRPLAEHFCKVIGIDISKSQIHVARKCTPQENITYQISPAEKMPLEDASVDLINVDLAAHWFLADQFILEVNRVLKKRGCLALHALYPKFALQYKNCSEKLTNICDEFLNNLYKHEDVFDIMSSLYEELFEALPFADKRRITGIPEIINLTPQELLGFFESSFMFQKFLTKDRAAATAFLQTVEKRIADAIGELSGDEILELHVKYFCVLACKS